MYGLWGVRGSLIAPGMTQPVVSILAFVTILGLSVWVDFTHQFPQGETAGLGAAALLV